MSSALGLRTDAVRLRVGDAGQGKVDGQQHWMAGDAGYRTLVAIPSCLPPRRWRVMVIGSSVDWAVAPLPWERWVGAGVAMEQPKTLVVGHRAPPVYEKAIQSLVLITGGWPPASVSRLHGIQVLSIQPWQLPVAQL